MTMTQHDELLKALKGIEEALLALRVPNTVYFPQPVYTPVYPSNPNTTPYFPPNTTLIITCGTGHAEGFKEPVQVHS